MCYDNIFYFAICFSLFYGKTNHNETRYSVISIKSLIYSTKWRENKIVYKEKMKGWKSLTTSSSWLELDWWCWVKESTVAIRLLLAAMTVKPYCVCFFYNQGGREREKFDRPLCIVWTLEWCSLLGHLFINIFVLKGNEKSKDN